MLPNPKISIVSHSDDVQRDVIQSSLLMTVMPGGSMIVGFDHRFNIDDDEMGEPEGYKTVLSFTMSSEDYNNLTLPEVTDGISTYKAMNFIADQHGEGYRRVEIRFNTALSDEEFNALVKAHGNEGIPSIIENMVKEELS